MDFSSIKKIVETEKEAEKIKEEARISAQKILQDTKDAKEATRLFHQKQMKRKEEELQKEQEDLTRKRIEEIKSQANENVQKTRENSKVNLQNAVDEIFKKIVNI